MDSRQEYGARRDSRVLAFSERLERVESDSAWRGTFLKAEVLRLTRFSFINWNRRSSLSLRRPIEELFERPGVQRLTAKEFGGNQIELGAPLLQGLLRVCVGLVEYPLDFFVTRGCLPPEKKRSEIA